MVYISDQSIGSLNPITQSELDPSNDLIPVWDQSEAEGARTKRVSLAGIFARYGLQEIWQSQTDDPFTRADSATVGNNWERLSATGTSSIVSNQMRIDRTPSGLTPFMVRPASENAINQEAQVFWVGSASYGVQVFVRIQDLNNYYGAAVSANGTAITLFRRVSGSNTTIGTFSLSSGIAASTNYSIRLRAHGTLISVEVRNETANTVLGSGSAIDATAGLQVAGRTGCCHNDDGFALIDRFVNRILQVTGGGSIANTDALPEGSINQYFTQARARGAFTAGTNISITNGVISAAGGGGGGSLTNLTDVDYISVKAHGAVSDGNEATFAGTDNTTAFTNAISDAVASDIRAVYVPPGVYRITNNIDIPSGITVYGAGHASCVMMTANSNGTDEQPNVLTISGSNVTIRNLRIRGKHAPTNSTATAASVTGFGDNNTSRGIQVQSTTIRNVLIENCIIHNCVLGGIRARAASDIRIINNLLYQNGDQNPACSEVEINTTASATDVPERIAIRGNFCLSNCDQKLSLANKSADDVVIADNIVISCNPDWSLAVGTTVNKTRHAANLVYAQGGDINAQKKVVITGNFFGCTKWTGLNINDSPGADVAHRCGSFTITGNMFWSIGHQTEADATVSSGIRGCIYMPGLGENDIISGNQFSDTLNNTPGLKFTGGNDDGSYSKRSNVSGNSFYNCQVGVMFSNNAKNIFVTGNSFKDSVLYDIGFQQSGGVGRVEIYGNKFERNNTSFPCISWVSGVNESLVFEVRNNKFVGFSSSTNAANNCAVFVRGLNAIITGNSIDNFFNGVYFNTINPGGRLNPYPVLDSNHFRNIGGIALRLSSSNAYALACNNTFDTVTTQVDSGILQGVRRGNFWDVMLAGAPTRGTWIVGDRVLRTAPAATGAVQDVCTAAGAPGTWRAI